MDNSKNKYIRTLDEIFKDMENFIKTSYGELTNHIKKITEELRENRGNYRF